MTSMTKNKETRRNGLSGREQTRARALTELPDNLCPTVNGYKKSDIDPTEQDAESLLRFLTIATQFNALTLELRYLRSEPKDDPSHKESEGKISSDIAEALEQKCAADSDFHHLGVVAEFTLSNGLVTDISYTSPRPRWNGTHSRIITLKVKI